MKVKNITKEQNKFKPITLEITIESEDELKDLYHRFIVTQDRLKYIENFDSKVGFPKQDHGDLFFTVINGICVDTGLKK